MIIPLPKNTEYAQGSYTISKGARVFIAAELAPAREGILSLLPFPETEAADALARFLFDASLDREAYRLICNANGVSIAAADMSGAVHGAATLAQLIAAGDGIPYLMIEDAPRFAWRGLSLDVCRHFFPTSTLEKVIDLLALYKFSVLHLHLSDDQGFRVESERFPRLNEIGSFRESSAVKRGRGEAQDNVPHGGFYTKAEVRSLVAHAAARGIEIVPEIDLPGHTSAILAAYPELSCDGRETKVVTEYGIKDFSAHILCAGEERVYDFLYALLEEMAKLFPARYFHLGGDEAVKDEWKKCPKCQKRMRELALENERELQGYMLERLRLRLAALGKEAVVWNDGLASAMGKGFVCQHWTPPAIEGDRRTAAHLNAGGRAIMSGFMYLYFDYPYAMTPIKKTYRYRILPRGLTEEAKARVLGCECALWTEWVEDEQKLFFNLLPRLAAAGELFWSEPSKRDYRDFVRRLPLQYQIYERLRLPYAKGMERPQHPLARLKTTRAFFAKDAYVELAAQAPSCEGREGMLR